MSARSGSDPTDDTAGDATAGDLAADGLDGATETPTISAPPLLLKLFEQLSLVEAATFVPLSPLLVLTEHGDGHPVLVLPGFGGSDRSTIALRSALKAKGYQPYGWELGSNIGPHRYITTGIVRRLMAIHRQHDRPVSLVGWSLGGVYARELAHDHPQAVRQVITLASPYRLRLGDASSASRLYDLIAPRHEPFAGRQLAEHDRPPLPVPATSIYTRTDGVVRWYGCIDAHGPLQENIEVRGTHNGLGVNIAAVIAITDRLSQPEGTWSPFRPPLAVRGLFPRPVSWRRRVGT